MKSQLNIRGYTFSRRTAQSISLALAFVFAASLASAQPVIDPNFVSFNKSPDHNAIAANGLPMVSRYDLEFYALGASLPLQVVDLGKPTPDAAGRIQVSFISSWPTPGMVYKARVAAVGPTGSGESTPSNSFTFTAQCAYVLSGTSLTLGAAGGPGIVNVLAGGGCTWFPVASSPWVTVQTPATTGSGSLSFVVAANTTAVARTATITLGGQVLVINQSAAAGTTSPPSTTCVRTVSPSSISVAGTGGTGTINVNISSVCDSGWNAVSPVPWLSLSPGSGTATGSFTYTVAPNTSTSSRTAMFAVNFGQVTVTQAGATATTCTFAASPASVSASAAGTTGTIGVTTTSGCGWTASSPVAWVSVTPASASGSGNAAYVVAANTTSTSRAATLTVAGKSVTVTQAAASCAFTATPNSISVVAAGASGTIAVTTSASCGWTASSPVSWITLTPASGSGNGSAAFTIAPNTGTIARTAILTVAGRSVTVSQSAAGTCTMSISQTNLSMPSAGGRGTIAVTAPAGCSWTTTGIDWAWFSAPGGGTGNGLATYNIDPNPLTTVRSTTVKVAGQSVTVSQAGQAPGTSCAFAVSPSNVTVPAAGATVAISVTTTTGCGWTADHPVPWLTVTPASGSGSAQITYVVAANTTTATRSVTLTVAGKSVVVTQPGTCSFTLSGSSFALPKTGGTGSVVVSTSGSCGWTVQKNVDWVSTSSTSGTGSSTVSFKVKPNNTKASRGTTLTIASQTVTVVEAN